MTKKSSTDKTVVARRPRRKTPDVELPVTTCHHCRRNDVQVMPSGLMAIHSVTGRWSRSMCRGSGDRVGASKRP